MPYEILIKFGQKEHMEALLNHGQIFMNTIAFYRSLEGDVERHDPNEGIEEIRQMDGGRMFRSDPDTGAQIEIAKITKGTLRVSNTALTNLNLYCVHYCAAPESAEVKLGDLVDSRASNGFGDSAVIIGDAAEFVTRVKNAVAALGFKHLHGIVKYDDLSNRNGDVGPFVKGLAYAHQKELRIAVSCEGRAPGPLMLSIGSISDIACLVPSQDIGTVILSEK